MVLMCTSGLLRIGRVLERVHLYPDAYPEGEPSIRSCSPVKRQKNNSAYSLFAKGKLEHFDVHKSAGDLDRVWLIDTTNGKYLPLV